MLNGEQFFQCDLARAGLSDAMTAMNDQEFSIEFRVKRLVLDILEGVNSDSGVIQSVINSDDIDEIISHLTGDSQVMDFRNAIADYIEKKKNETGVYIYHWFDHCELLLERDIPNNKKAELYAILGERYRETSSEKESIQNYENALKYYEGKDKSFIFKIRKSLAQIYFEQKCYEKSNEHYLRLTKYKFEKEELNEIYQKISLNFLHLEEYKKSLQYALKYLHLDISQLSGDEQTHLGKIYLGLGNYEKSREYLLAAFQVENNPKKRKEILEGLMKNEELYD